MSDDESPPEGAAGGASGAAGATGAGATPTGGGAATGGVGTGGASGATAGGAGGAAGGASGAGGGSGAAAGGAGGASGAAGAGGADGAAGAGGASGATGAGGASGAAGAGGASGAAGAGGASGAAGAGGAGGGTCAGAINVRVAGGDNGGIDAMDRLHVKGDQMWWEHFTGEYPGEHRDKNVATLVKSDQNGSANAAATWCPVFAGCNVCTSSCAPSAISSDPFVLAPPQFPLPAGDLSVTLTVTEGRNPVTVAQEPTLANGGELIILFNDTSSGSATYDITASYTSASPCGS